MLNDGWQAVSERVKALRTRRSRKKVMGEVEVTDQTGGSDGWIEQQMHCDWESVLAAGGTPTTTNWTAKEGSTS